MPLTAKQTIKLLAIGLLVLLGIVLSPAVRNFFWEVYIALKRTFGVAVDLTQMGLIAVIFAAFLAPLEALGWWAGWYGDDIETVVAPGMVERPVADREAIVHYVIYLDGIGQAQYSYLPDVEEFLDQLERTLPQNILLIRGIMPYSVLNRPLTEDRLLAPLWRFADRMQIARYGTLVGTLTSFIINIRNILIVSVSADKRYGPIYNQGMAQVMYNSLLNRGYRPGSGIPVTLIGFSGGGQISMGAVPFLKRALKAPIEVISIAGVFGGSANALKLEHVYHFVGDKDPIERIGPVMFPKRWKVFFLSYWNRAKRMGKVSIASLGAVGHTGAGSAFDPQLVLPDGRTALQQTIDLVSSILMDRYHLPTSTLPQHKQSNYDRYQQAAFNHCDEYPIDQSVSLEWYQPIAPWVGRLILPQQKQRHPGKGVLFEVHHAPPGYEQFVGKVVPLRWSDDPRVQRYVCTVTTDVYFNATAEYSRTQGIVHPDRLNQMRQVDPLESLAGARPNDDMIVRLGDVIVQGMELCISQEPIQITGRFYALVSFLGAVDADSEQFRVVHFNRATKQFDGATEIVRLPQVIADENGVFNSTSRDIEKSPLNTTGWYIYGAKDATGMFVVQSIAPRSLFQLQPSDVIVGKKPAFQYLKQRAWSPTEVPKGHAKPVLLCGKELASDDEHSPIQGFISYGQEGSSEAFPEGTRALVIHNYGGIGGKKMEPAAKGPVYFGHFAYGIAEVIREPLADELQFDIIYYQVYTQNTDGIVAGALHWSRFLGDRQFGWAGVRPTCDLLIKLDAFTEDYDFDGIKRSALDQLVYELQIMTARYRTGDGTGGTYVGPANNCSQDSNQAMYATIRKIRSAIESEPYLQDWMTRNPDQAIRFRQLVNLGKSLRNELLPFGAARADWQTDDDDELGLSMEDEPIETLLRGLVSWRTMFPRIASDSIAKIFLQQGAMIWVLRTNQIGGFDPDIEAVAPMTL